MILRTEKSMTYLQWKVSCPFCTSFFFTRKISKEMSSHGKEHNFMLWLLEKYVTVRKCFLVYNWILIDPGTS